MLNKISKEEDRRLIDPDLLMKPISHLSLIPQEKVVRQIMESFLLCCSGGLEHRNVLRGDGIFPILRMVDEEVGKLKSENLVPSSTTQGTLDVEISTKSQEEEESGEESLSQLIYNVISFLLREEGEEASREEGSLRGGEEEEETESKT